MAVLSKIRQRSLLLILVIGFCLFAFVVGDLIQNGRFNQPSKDVGSINGKEIPFEDFRIKVSNVEKSGQGTTSIQAANQVWNQEVNIALLTAEFDKLGLRVGEKHIIEILKNDPNIGQNQMFLNDAGKFDVVKFKEFFKSNPQGLTMLKEQEKNAEINAKFQIYNSLVKGSLFTTDAEGKLKYEMENNKVNFDFVSVPFSSIKDSDVKVSDDEIVSYMKKREKKFKSEESRELDFVLIEEKPSKEDEAEIKKSVDALMSERIVYNAKTGKNDTIPGFRNVKDNAKFVNENSDIPFDSTYVAKKDLPAEHAEKLFALAPGEIYGPYMFGNYYCISKGLGRKSGANAKASHILISYEGTQVPNKKEVRTKEEAKAKAESLLAQALANPSSFAVLALQNSDDSSAQQGGDLGYFGPNQMVKPFNDFVFNNGIGKIGMVETDFGFHVINITDKQDAVRLATVAQKIEASELTNDKIYTQATKFEMDAANKDFAAVAKELNLSVNPSVRVKAVDEYFGSLGSQRQIVRWAFSDANVGDVKRFEVANMGHVIVKLNKVNKKGLAPVEEARPMVEPIIKNQKKAELIKAKLTGSSLDAMAKANKVTVQQAMDITLETPALPGAGYEPKVVGVAFATPKGKLSSPIEGMSGVYVVLPKSVTKAPALKKHDEYVNKIKSQVQSYSGRVMNALKNEADIEDNRAEFY